MIELPVLDKAQVQGDPEGPRLWRSLPHLKNDPEFRAALQQEFMPGATEPPSGATRRQFLQLMGASMALAGLTACRRPVEKILPYTRKPEEIVEGIPNYYATAMPFRGIVRGLLVESHEGRPTKVEGNPDHPVTLGTTSAFEQASILNLYDPDRSRQVLHEGALTTWESFLRFVREFAVGAADRRVVVLSEPTSSPTLLAMRTLLEQRFPQARWITYEPEGGNPSRQGLQMATGRSLRPQYDFEGAQVIVSLDADFLGPTEPNFIQNTRSFVRSHLAETPDDTMSRLYVVESDYTITGGNADHRRPLRSSLIPAFAAALAARLGLGGDAGAGAAYADEPFLIAMADDLREAGSRGVVLAGETQPPEVHALCAAINASLGSTVVTYLETDEEIVPPQPETMAGLVDAMRSGAVDALLMLDVNPVQSMPAEYGFAEALRGVEQTIHFGMYLDETAVLSRWHIPASHYLEYWGDGRAYDGTLSVIQPLIAPLYDTRSAIEVLHAFATGIDRPGYELVRERWQEILPGDFEAAWTRVLHDGYLPDSGYPTASAGAGAAALPALAAPLPDELEVVFRLDPKVLDGRFSNNAWMQEMPHPTTKISWDNPAVMSMGTAQQLGLQVEYGEGKFYADVIEVALGDRVATLPVWIQPGVADGSIHVNLGYGRTLKTIRPEREGRWYDLDVYTDIYGHGPIANAVGTNVAPIRSRAFERVAVGAQVRRVDSGYMLASSQEHGSMEGRPLVRMATLETFRQNPTFAPDAVEALPGGEPWDEYPTLWEDRHPAGKPAYQDSLYYKNQWGMSIDLNKCTGCHACMIACVSENNVQMVGKEELSRGREMFWLRIDRYFVTEAGEGEDVTNPRMVFQPMLCQHCENAPCEPVCPVAATSHSADGLNEMTYNRCIGTRYCSNNCPYKVRRYNFFNWAQTIPNPVEMAYNPNVTVRFRGVMEKCTYCVQRIRNVQRQADIEQRPIRDGEVMTACQQVCPAEAIVFGDLTDTGSRIDRAKHSPRRYEVLGELNTQPRTSYQARIYNPNPRLLAAAAPAPAAEAPAQH